MKKGLSKDIQHRIRRYLEFYLAKENALRTEGDNTIQLLSQSLKDDIIKEVNAKLLNDTYMFSFNFRKKFLYLISRDFAEKSFGPDEIIFRHGAHDDFSVYFVISGKVEIYYERCEITLQHLQKGDTFGFLAFFSGKPRTATARSLEFTTVFVMDRNKFQQKLEEFPTEKEMYIMIQDSLNHYNNFQFLNITCYSCGSKEHIALECPKVHFNYNRQKIITNHLLEEENFRKGFKRKTRKKTRALLDLEGIQEAAAQHQMIQQNELYFDNDENDENAEIRSYSSIDDVFDRNMYDPQPIAYNIDATQVQAVVIGGESETAATLTSADTPLLKKHKKKKGKRNMGEIETFVTQYYDKYYHTLSLDKVKNFEVYNPSENITRMIVAFEKTRLQKIVENRLGVGAKHISRLLVKGFRMHERAKAPSPSMSSCGSVRSVDTDRKNNNNNNLSSPVQDNFRRVSVSVNPADIAMYNTGERKTMPKRDDSASKMSISKISKDPIDVLLRVPGIQPSNVTEVRNAMAALHANRMERQSSRSGGLTLAKKKKKEMSIDDKIINRGSRGSVKGSMAFNDDSKRKLSDSPDDEPPSSPETDSSSDTRSISAGKSRELLGVRSDNEEKLPTASFGDEGKLKKNKHKNKIISSMTQPLNAVNVGSFSSSQLLNKKVARKSVFEVPGKRKLSSKRNFGSEAGTSQFELEDSGAKKPIALFDFSLLLKKMTTKLEENSSRQSVSSLRSKESPLFLPRKETPSQYKKAANKKDFVPYVAASEKSGCEFKKKIEIKFSRNGKEINKFIDKHNLEEILQSK